MTDLIGLIDLNDMLTHLGLFNARSLEIAFIVNLYLHLYVDIS